MKIAGIYEIVKNKQGEIWTNIVDTAKWETYKNKEITRILERVLSAARSSKVDEASLQSFAEAAQTRVKNILQDEKALCGIPSWFNGHKNEWAANMITRLMNFFSEFNFEPNFRFINTFAHAAKADKAFAYVGSYFDLTDNQDKVSIKNKCASQEFVKLVEDFSAYNFDNHINTRLKIYYGSQGTGKTTLAMSEADSTMVCHSAMLPSDLMEDFKFVNGQPQFTPSALQTAIIEGKTIVLDEMNLLPFESLRFLQSILDGKKEFSYKGNVIHIHDDFKVIGTMNLVVNGCVYSLPEPLVDRAMELREFKLTAEDLVGALM